MSQAIVTKYLPATNTKPSRIKAQCERGSLTVSMSYEGGIDFEHVNAAKALCAKFVSEDVAKYGSHPKTNPWGRPFVTGCLPSGNYAHVFTS